MPVRIRFGCCLSLHFRSDSTSLTSASARTDGEEAGQPGLGLSKLTSGLAAADRIAQSADCRTRELTAPTEILIVDEMGEGGRWAPAPVSRGYRSPG